MLRQNRMAMELNNPAAGDVRDATPRRGAPPDQRLPRSQRLRNQTDFNRVFGGKHYAADDVLVINAAANRVGHPRLGLSMSRKVGNAVVRNRWKRLIRESFRQAKHDLPSHLDLIVRPRRGAAPSFVAIDRSLRSLCRRLAKRIAPPKSERDA